MTTVFDSYHEIIPEFSNFQETLHISLPIHIRVNRLIVKPDLVVDSLEEKGIYLEKSFKKNDTLYLVPTLKSPGNLMEYFLGHIHPQALTSCLASIVLSPEKNSYVL